MKILRQGDVTLVQVSKLPKDAKNVTPEGDVILMHGEQTGHCHRIKEGTVELFDAGAYRFIKLLEKTALTHEEHSAIFLDKGGIYRQAFQVEDYGTEIKRVAD